MRLRTTSLYIWRAGRADGWRHAVDRVVPPTVTFVDNFADVLVGVAQPLLTAFRRLFCLCGRIHVYAVVYFALLAVALFGFFSVPNERRNRWFTGWSAAADHHYTWRVPYPIT